MENYNGEKVCRLCLNSTCSPIELTSHEAGLQMCGLCLPEIDLSICYDSALCSKCFHYLENVYIFKIRCLQTEEKLRLYLENCDPQKINLQHIMECVTNVEDELDSEICRSCLTTSSEFTSVGENDPILRNMFATCIPEMDLSLLSSPVICNSCVNRVKDFTLSNQNVYKLKEN
ncbi:hypothetical protein HHI36_006473 [Cryptolaemus montrouzieri]|uniref:ZAD domain-containing protein n=1 Tax=Cryptolaemus montrouzieri TaxID=559131 RepID=A0ABD2NYL2_9CUCU